MVEDIFQCTNLSSLFIVDFLMREICHYKPDPDILVGSMSGFQNKVGSGSGVNIKI